MTIAVDVSGTNERVVKTAGTFAASPKLSPQSTASLFRIKRIESFEYEVKGEWILRRA
jgi:hypothetical protein